MGSTDIAAGGAIKSRERRLAEGALYDMEALGGKTHLVPSGARPAPVERNYLIPAHEDWEAWVVDAYEGAPIDEIALRHGVPIREVLEFFQSPGIVRDTYQMLDRQRHSEAKTRALLLSIQTLDSQDTKMALEAVARITKLLEVRLEQDRAEDVMSPEERDQHYRRLVLSEES